MKSPIITLEISVDRTNEKGVFVANQILSTLHYSTAHPMGFWARIFPARFPTIFRFRIMMVRGQIRFFLSAEEQYIGLLQSQLYAHYPNIEISPVSDPIDQDESRYVIEDILPESLDLSMLRTYMTLSDRTEKDSIDPIGSMTSALAQTPPGEIAFLQIDFAPRGEGWKTGASRLIFSARWIPTPLKRIFLTDTLSLRLLFFPLTLLFWILGLFIGRSESPEGVESPQGEKGKQNPKKTEYLGFSTRITIAKSQKDTIVDRSILRELSGSLHIFSSLDGSRLRQSTTREVFYREIDRLAPRSAHILTNIELAGFVHIPTMTVKTPGIRWVMSRRLEPPHELPPLHLDSTPIGQANFRGRLTPFALRSSDRARHTYIIGKTGMGKSTLLENMIYADILAGRGVAVIDPHGDLADTILEHIPKSRTNDLVIFDPSDREHPIGFNMLDNTDPNLRSIVAGGLVSIFKKMFAESWGPRLEYILRNTILSLLFVPDSTLISIPLILTHESYRRRVISKITDPILIQFWEKEFASMTPQMMSEAINPILNKVGQFLSYPVLRNILGQVKNPFSLRWIMDNGKIFIVKLPKGTIGEDASALLGAMMVTKFQIEAMTRADTPEADRRDFGLYVDEFQNFATESFATILSEARKYKLSLTMANQYIAQMPETVQGAVFGNVGTLVAFQIGHHDATVMSEVFGGEDIITPHNLTNLRKYDIYTKLLIDGMPSPVFSATTFAPLHSRVEIHSEQSRETLMKVSREKYTKKKAFVEKKIFDMAKKINEEERDYRKAQTEKKEKQQQEKREHSRK